MIAKPISTLFVLSMLLISTNAISSESNFYTGLDYLKQNVTTLGNIDSVAIKLGYDINKVFAVEGHFYGSETYKIESAGTTSNIDRNYGSALFARANYRINNFQLYGLLGAGYIKNQSLNYSKTGLAYGLGIDYFLDENNAINIAATRYIDTKTNNFNITVDSYGVGFKHYITSEKRYYANSPLYMGIDIADLNSSKAYILRIGNDFNNYLGFEGHLITSTSNDSSSTTTSSFSGASAFARGNYRLESVTLYGLAGYSYLVEDKINSGVNSKSTFSAPSYGFGIDFHGGKNISLTISHITYLNMSTYSSHVDATTLGIKYYFDPPRSSERY